MANLGKSFDSAAVQHFIRRARRYELKLNVSLVFGGPGETEDSIRRSAEFANEHLEAGELTIHVGYRILPHTGLARSTGLSADELLEPTFYPFDLRAFEWIVKYLDSRFFTTPGLMNLMAGRSASRRMLPVKVPDHSAPGFGYSAISRLTKAIAVRAT
jgi:radical SAM superfamily enzyme YgiQ (UPF0313 family)